MWVGARAGAEFGSVWFGSVWWGWKRREGERDFSFIYVLSSRLFLGVFAWGGGLQNRTREMWRLTDPCDGRWASFISYPLCVPPD